ncbi:MAG: hypothetical protein ACJ70X_05695, partial [Nitrososphaera sp.]
MSQHSIASIGPAVAVVAAIALMMIIITSSILQPVLTTGTDSLPTNTTSYDDYNNNIEYNSTMLAQSNQSNISLHDKTNVTLGGLFTDLGDPGRWNKLLQPALNELNRRHPDMNIQ